MFGEAPGFPLVFVEAVVHLDHALVALGLVAQASQRAAFAVLGTVACALAAVAACCL